MPPIGTVSLMPTVADQEIAIESPEPPPLIIQGWNFAKAMVRWKLSGLPLLEKEEISRRLEICQKCPALKNDYCTNCGCACKGRVSFMNKLAVPTEHCPVNRW